MNFSSPSLHPRNVVIVAAAAAVLLLGTVAAVSAISWDKHVTLEVDGRTITERTSATVVDELLAENGVEPAPEDRVISPAEPLSNGDVVRVRTAKPLTLVVDGEVTSTVTHEIKVADALADEGVTVEAGAWLSDDLDDTLSAEGNLVVVSNPKTLKVRVDGKTERVTSPAPTVEAFLEAAGVTLNVLDEVNRGSWRYLSPGDHLKVTRIEHVERTEQLPVDFDVAVQKDDSMYTTDRVVVTTGKPGLDRAKVELVLADGKVRERTIVSRTSIRPPIDQVEKHGTKDPNSINGGVWDRLAACESGGNWSINTGNGYYGGLQFSASTWRSVGGSGLPHQNSKAEQIKRGKILQERAGWGQWPHCTKKLGLR